MDTRVKLAIIPTLAVISVTAVLLYGLDLYVTSQFRDHMIEDITNSASSAALAVAIQGKNHDISEMDALADELGRSSNRRITIIMHTGKVIGDSERSIAQVRSMENYLQRPEIKDAFNKGIGIAQRHSASLGKEMLYVAVRQQVADKHTHTHTTEGVHGEDERHYHVVRAAIDLDEVTSQLHLIQMAFIVVAILGVITILGFGLAQSRNASRQLAEGTTQLEHEVEKRTQDVVMLQRLGSSLSACGSMEEAGDVIQLIVGRILPQTSGGVYITKASRNLEDLLVSWGEAWDGPEQFSPSNCWAMRKGRIHRSNEDDLRMLCSHLEAQTFSQSLCIPLIAQGESLGTFTILTDAADWRAEEIKMAQTLAEQISLILASLQLREDLRQQAIRDPLTGLFNRRYMLESLFQVIGRAERHKSKVGVYMIDVDNFKRFNDTYGHDLGDLVLKQIASGMKLSSRKEDTLSRYGGEEFCLICPDLDANHAKELGERLCDQVRHITLDVKGGNLSSFSISVGIAVYPEDGRGCEDLLRVADEALYQAKSQGKNRAVLAGEKPESKVEHIVVN